MTEWKHAFMCVEGAWGGGGGHLKQLLSRPSIIAFGTVQFADAIGCVYELRKILPLCPVHYDSRVSTYSQHMITVVFLGGVGWGLINYGV